MLNTTYKIYAKAIALRISSHLDQCTRKRQKGLVKGIFLLDAVINFLEGFKYAEEFHQYFWF